MQLESQESVLNVSDASGFWSDLQRGSRRGPGARGISS